MFQATRRRLALWYTAVTAVLLLVFATGVYMYVRSTLIERVDDTLNHVVEVIQRSLVIESLPKGQFRVNVEASFRNNADTVEDDHIDLEWFSPTGKLLWSTLSEPLNIPLRGPNRTGETVKVARGTRDTAASLSLASRKQRQQNGEAQTPTGVFLRQVTERVQIGRQVLGYLRVSHPWFEVTKPTRLLILDLSLGIALMVISVAASGWWLSGLAMEPVRASYQRLKQFTADASHELRNPIAMIQTNVQVALADPDLDRADGMVPPHYQQQLKVIERLTRRLGRLVDDLLFLARQDSSMVQPNRVNVPLDALLMEVIEEQQLLATEKNIILLLNLVDPSVADIELGSSDRGGFDQNAEQAKQLTSLHEQLDKLPNSPSLTPPYTSFSKEEQNLKSEEEAFTILGDWNQLARLFTNLVSNALQYTPAEGQVEVELQLCGRQLQVSVRDNGIGIPPEALPHIFDRFYRADPARTHAGSSSKVTGSGLGLAIAQAIVHNHHGHIQIESILHQGTTVIVTLPKLKQEMPI